MFKVLSIFGTRPEKSKTVPVIRELEKLNSSLKTSFAATIVAAASELLADNAIYKLMSPAQNPFGDGKAAARIVAVFADLAAERPRHDFVAVSAAVCCEDLL